MRRFGIYVFLATFLLVACQQAAPTAESYKTAIPPMPPKTGLVTITGRLVLDATLKPVPNMDIRLVIAHPPPADLWIDDPVNPPGASTTDAEGYFTIENAPPGNYILVAGYQDYGLYGIIRSGPDTARLFELVADKLMELGDVKVVFN